METEFAYQFKTEEDLMNFIRENILLGAEVVDVMGISKQRVNKKVQDKQLIPIKDLGKGGRLYFKKNVLESAKQSRPGRPKKSVE